MTNDDGRKPEGAPERSAKAGAGAPSGVDGSRTVHGRSLTRREQKYYQGLACLDLSSGRVAPSETTTREPPALRRGFFLGEAPAPASSRSAPSNRVGAAHDARLHSATYQARPQGHSRRIHQLTLET